MFCQKCRTPLTLDSSLDNLGPSAFNILTDAATKRQQPDTLKSRPLYNEQQKSLYDHVSSSTSSPTYKRTITPGRHGIDGHHARSHAGSHQAMSYVMLTESQVQPPTSSRIPTPPSTPPQQPTNRHSSRTITDDTSNLLSHKVETTARLFSILSSHSDIDHPICTECTALLTAGLEKRLQFATKERDAYVKFLRDAAADVPTDAEREAAEADLTTLREQEAAAMKELEDLEAEQAGLEEEMAALQAEAEQLDKEENAFFRSRNAFMQELVAYQEEKASLSLRIAHDTRQLERLQRTNVYNDAFNIGHDGFFGTINGLRLGRLPGKGVEWAEVNAAWGQTCLLLTVVAEKLDFEFNGWRLKPVGSTSQIEKLEGMKDSTASTTSAKIAQGGTKSLTAVQVLPLYYSSELPISLGFMHRTFDSGMMAFLDCVNQLGKHVEKTTAEEAIASNTRATPGQQQITGGLKLPYVINKDMIHDVSIKLSGGLGGGGDEKWTRACKYLLTCCKMLLAHASNINEDHGKT